MSTKGRRHLVIWIQTSSGLHVRWQWHGFKRPERTLQTLSYRTGRSHCRQTCSKLKEDFRGYHTPSILHRCPHHLWAPVQQLV